MSNMVVRTNIYALNAHRNMKNVGLQQKQAANRLASGYRVNSAADDAAGLAISENMRAQIRGLDQASRNAQDGQAMILTTEGGLEEIGNILQRVRELLVQASNDNNTQAQRSMIEQEIAQLGDEIHGMQTRVEFNTNQVLNIGRHSQIQMDIADANVLFAEAQVMVAEASAAYAEAVSDAKQAYAEAMCKNEGAGAALAEAMRAAAEAFNTRMAEANSASDQAAARTAAMALFDADKALANSEYKQTLSEATKALEEAMQIATAELRAVRNDYITAAHLFTGTITTQFHVLSEDVLDGVGVAWFQVGANSNQGIKFDFATVSQAVSVSGHLVKGVADVLVMSGSFRESGIGFGEDISTLINYVNDGLEAINSVRANLGAVQNRMDYTMRSLDISSENLSDSESRIRNADIAKEMMRFTMTNVLQQAGVSMLSQANQMPNNLLQLLR